MRPRLLFPTFLVVLGLAGCATPERLSEPLPAPPPVATHTWQQVDRDILAEAQAASDVAKDFAGRRMAQWRQLVEKRAEADFIPWFSSYLTQQWLTTKIAWYELSADEGSRPPVDRLATYLQEQYYERVLTPVAKEIDPATVTGQATKRYVEQLAAGIKPLARRYAIPAAQFERRLQDLPAIALAPPAAHNASLYQLIEAGQIDALPAYAALLRQIRAANEKAGAGLSKTRISPVARQVSQEMLNRLAIGGGTSAATTLIGGVAGTVISIGAAGLGIMLHEAKRGAIESRLRNILDASLDDMWQLLMSDPETGVTAGIHHLNEQIGKSFPQTFSQPVVGEQLLQEIPLPDLPSAPDAMIEPPAAVPAPDREP